MGRIAAAARATGRAVRRAVGTVVRWLRPPAAPAPPLRTARRLSAAATGLMAVSSAAGLAAPAVYRDPLAVAAMFRAWDLVTLSVVTPVLVGALLRARGGSPRARLLWAGMLACAVYQYAYYVFGAALGPLLLAHVGVFLLAVLALAALVRAADLPGIALHPRTPRRPVAAVLAFLAAGLGGMWTGNAVRSAVTGAPLPATLLVQPPAVLRLGYVLDLVALVPAYAAAAVLLWRGSAWGAPLATVVLTGSTPVQLAYLAALPAQVAAGVRGAVRSDPQEPPIAALITAAAGVLLGGVRPRTA
ncbi:hypothetical protein ACI8AF_25715 [Blastococcus sp. SYSU D00669]